MNEYFKILKNLNEGNSKCPNAFLYFNEIFNKIENFNGGEQPPYFIINLYGTNSNEKFLFFQALIKKYFLRNLIALNEFILQENSSICLPNFIANNSEVVDDFILHLKGISNEILHFEGANNTKSSITKNRKLFCIEEQLIKSNSLPFLKLLFRNALLFDYLPKTLKVKTTPRSPLFIVTQGSSDLEYIKDNLVVTNVKNCGDIKILSIEEFENKNDVTGDYLFLNCLSMLNALSNNENYCNLKKYIFIEENKIDFKQIQELQQNNDLYFLRLSAPDFIFFRELEKYEGELSFLSADEKMSNNIKTYLDCFQNPDTPALKNIKELKISGRSFFTPSLFKQYLFFPVLKEDENFSKYWAILKKDIDENITDSSKVLSAFEQINPFDKDDTINIFKSLEKEQKPDFWIIPKGFTQAIIDFFIEDLKIDKKKIKKETEIDFDFIYENREKKILSTFFSINLAKKLQLTGIKNVYFIVPENIPNVDINFADDDILRSLAKCKFRRQILKWDIPTPAEIAPDQPNNKQEDLKLGDIDDVVESEEDNFIEKLIENRENKIIVKINNKLELPGGSKIIAFIDDKAKKISAIDLPEIIDKHENVKYYQLSKESFAQSFSTGFNLQEFENSNLPPWRYGLKLKLTEYGNNIGSLYNELNENKIIAIQLNTFENTWLNDNPNPYLPRNVNSYKKLNEFLGFNILEAERYKVIIKKDRNDVSKYLLKIQALIIRYYDNFKGSNVINNINLEDYKNLIPEQIDNNQEKIQYLKEFIEIADSNAIAVESAVIINKN
jgi:hypothetical protein